MLESGVSELRDAFVLHRRVGEGGSDPSHHLLLFYAAECGLKLAWLRRNRFWTTAQIRDEQLRKSHDLSRWVKELRVPASMASPMHDVRLERGGSAELRRVHEAWRYGVRIVEQDEGHIVNWLRRVCGWVHEEVQR